MVALNSNCGDDPDVPTEVVNDFGGCGDDSPQMTWLRTDLANHPNGCRMAMWHHPRFSQSTEGSTPKMDTAWRLLAEAGFDLVVNGHAHDYQRYPRLGPTGEPNGNGLRELVIGTGGSWFSAFSEARAQRSPRRPHPRIGGTRPSGRGLHLEVHGHRWNLHGRRNRSMPSLTRLALHALALAFLATLTRPCRADGPTMVPDEGSESIATAEPAAPAQSLRLSGKLGYSAAWTNGSTNFGPSLGLEAAYLSTYGHLLSLNAARFLGAQQCTSAGPLYCVNSSAYVVNLGLGQHFGGVAFFEVRANAGALFTVESTRVLDARMSSTQMLFAFGPAFMAGAHAGRWVLGFSFEAYEAPARVASPWLSGSFQVGATL